MQIRLLGRQLDIYKSEARGQGPDYRYELRTEEHIISS